MAKLRAELTAIRNALQSLVDKDDDSEVIELEDLIENLDIILVNSKKESFTAFDLVNKSYESLLATTNSKNDSIHVSGCSTDSFDLELAMGVLARIRKNVKKEVMYTLFIKMMEGAYDND